MATEAAAALLDWGVTEFGLHRVYGRCHARPGGGGNGDGGGGGGLPITGASVFTVAAAGIPLVLIGVVALWHTRRIRWVVRK
ncbi:GNAT family N-acetyltransferase [Micromonospora chokoriensis]|uniref:GNAT family N-acetyltransferase n=1 Tax=Micromonospora chokoriensis TaxID=356851 RepID=UPI001E4941E8|nr:GNAT family N-acetyltransferase [Micromonospora chokoriensis]